MKYVLVALFSIFFSVNQVNAKLSTVEVNTEGTGTTKQLAILDGLKNAITQVNGAVVGANSAVSISEASSSQDQNSSYESSQAFQQNIKSATKGVVQGFDVLSVSQKIKFKIVNIEKESKRISLSYKATLENPWNKVKDKIGQDSKIKIKNITDKAIFGEIIDSNLSGMLHYKELSYDENIEDLKKFKKNDIIDVKIIEVKDDKIRFSKRALLKDPLDWFKDNNKKVGNIITTRIHEVLKTGVKVSVDKEKKLIVNIRKTDLAKDVADARPEVFSPGNALDAKITELDLKARKVKLSVKAALIDEEKSLIAKFGEGATKSGATLKGIFEKAIGKKGKKLK